MHPSADDLQAVYGFRHIQFEQRKLNIDLNSDGIDERVILMVNRLRRLSLPENGSDLNAGTTVDAFAVFDGLHPSVLLFYQYSDEGFGLRFDEVDGQHLLVADGGKDRVQHAWGWWRYSYDWPPNGWEARQRGWNEQTSNYESWRPAQQILVNTGK